MLELAPLIIVIVLAVVFDFINGFHDTANAIATRVLASAQAILMAAVLNFLSAITGTAVAKTLLLRLLRKRRQQRFSRGTAQ